jgi:hypothetical protein
MAISEDRGAAVGHGGARMIAPCGMQIESDKTDILKSLISIYKGSGGAVHVGSIKE